MPRRPKLQLRPNVVKGMFGAPLLAASKGEGSIEPIELPLPIGLHKERQALEDHSANKQRRWKSSAQLLIKIATSYQKHRMKMFIYNA